MPGKIKHIAISSGNNTNLLDFYEALFGMKRSTGGSHVSDGYVGLNVNSRGRGRQAGLDHFGFEVEDIEAVCARVRDDYPEIDFLRRPGNRPFAAIGMHDPLGNVFDLSGQGLENRKGLYAENLDDWAPRHITHLVLRAVQPNVIADFYRDVFQMREKESAPADPNRYLSDGRVTLVIAPWRITDYYGTGVERPAIEHIGFEVESLDAFKADLERIYGSDSFEAPRKAGSDEDNVRMKLLAGCHLGSFQLSDPDGVLIDVAEARS